MNYSNAQEIAQAIAEILEDKAVAQQLAAQAKPAVWLETTAVDDEADIALGSTKIGGQPDLPVDAVWPERERYPDHHKRVETHRVDSVAPDSRWRWATPEKAQQIREEALLHIQRLENPFPLNFLAQINFAEIGAVGPVDEDFPESGVLSVFYDLFEQPWGYDPADANALKLIFSDDTAALQRRELPQKLQALGDEGRLNAVACTLHACCTPLPMETSQWDRLGIALSDEQSDDFVDWWLDDSGNAASTDGEDASCHRVGGWPTPVQGDMQAECALVAAGHYCGSGNSYTDPALQPVRDTATEWLLLLQLGSDDKASTSWGDSGQLYLWIRRDDLRARRFDAARLVLQCY